MYFLSVYRVLYRNLYKKRMKLAYIAIWVSVVLTVDGHTSCSVRSKRITHCKDIECCEFSKGRYPSTKRINQNCFTGRGHDFRGKQNISRDGRICMNWREEGGEFWGRKTRRSRYGIGDHNYCRNPDLNYSNGPWCYVDYGLFSRCDIPACKDCEYDPTIYSQNRTESTLPDVMYLFKDEVFYITKNRIKNTYGVYKFSDVNMTSVADPPQQDLSYAFNLCINNTSRDVMTFATSYDDKKMFVYFERPGDMVEIKFTPTPSWTIVKENCLSNVTSRSNLLLRQMFSMNEPHVVFLLSNDQMIRCEWKNGILEFVNSTKSPYGDSSQGSLHFKDQQGIYFQLRDSSTASQTSVQNVISSNTKAVDRYPALAYPLLEYDYLNKKSLVKLRTSKEFCKKDGNKSRIYQLYDGDQLDDIIRWLQKREGWLRVHNINIRKSSFCETVEKVSCCREITQQILQSESKVRFAIENDNTCNSEHFFIYCKAYFSNEKKKCPSVSCFDDLQDIGIDEAVICEIQMEKDPPCSISLEKILIDSESYEITYKNAEEAFDKIDAVAASINYQDKNSTKILSTLIGSVNALENVNYSSLSRSKAEEMISNVVNIVDNIVDDDRVDVWMNLQEEEKTIKRKNKNTNTTIGTPTAKEKTSSPTDMLFRMENVLGEIVSAQQGNDDINNNSSLSMMFKTKNAISVIQKLGDEKVDFDVDNNFMKFDCAAAEENDTITIVSKYPKLMHLISQVENTIAGSNNEKGKASSIEYVRSAPVVSASVLKNGKRIHSGVTFIIPYNFDDLPDPKQRHSKFYFTCRYLAESDDNDENRWDKSGCEVSKVDHEKKFVYCSCNHTTNFAILLQVIPPKIKKEDMVKLQVVSYIGETISVACLFITLTTFIVLRSSLKSPRMVAHFHLVIALLVFHSTQLLVNFAEEEKNASSVSCIVVTFLTHFSLLASFCWMLVEGMLLHMSVISVFHSKKFMEVFRYILGWVFPGVIAVVTILYGLTRLPYPTCYLEGVGEMSCSDNLAFNTDSQPSTQLVEWCWLSSDNYLVWAMAAPALIAILTNTVILIRVTWVIAETSKATNMYRPTTEQKKDKHIRKCLKGAVILMPILGIPWIFGFIPQAASHVALLYVFAVVNSLQGFFIMLFYCILSSEVRSAFNRFVRKRNILHSQNWSINSSGKHTSSEFKSGSRRSNTSATELIKTDSKSSNKRNLRLFSSKRKLLPSNISNNNAPREAINRESGC